MFTEVNLNHTRYCYCSKCPTRTLNVFVLCQQTQNKIENKLTNYSALQMTLDCHHMNRKMHECPNNQSSSDGKYQSDHFDTVLSTPYNNYCNEGRRQMFGHGGPLRVTCGELREKHTGRIVELVGRVSHQRKGKFVLLRDGHGSTQLVVPENRTDIIKRFANLPLQSYVSIIGRVSKRPLGAKNEKMDTGDVEVVMEEFVLVKVNREGPRLPKCTPPGILQARSMATSARVPGVLTTEEFLKCGHSKNLETQLKGRSLTCGDLHEGSVNHLVSLLGWPQTLALPRFLQLKDGHGSIQCLLPANKPELQSIASQINSESILEVKGKVSRRPDNCVNLKSESGCIEIIVDSLAILDPHASTRSPSPENKEDITEVRNRGVNSNTQRTHTCGELRLEHSGTETSLCGWLEFKRRERFFTLRDAYGSTQCIIPEEMISKLPNLESIPLESVLQVSGQVVSRPGESANMSMATGEIEVVVTDLRVLNPATFQPFNVRSFQRAKEQLRLQHRYIDLRFPNMQCNLRTRSDMLMKMRKYLCDDHCFVEVETPTLFCRTPGGAQEFVVPTRHKGQFYSLVQSPQQFKQMLMAGSIDRYFQVARCYRDESIRGDRQPEFTQLDVEMSFAGREDILALMEGLLKASWPRPLPDKIPRLTYQEAISTYGSDKPDVSYSLQLQNITEVMKTNEIIVQRSPKEFSSFAIVGRGSNSSIAPQLRKSLQSYADNKYPKVKCFLIKIKDPLEKWFSSKLNTVLGENVMRKLADNLNLAQEDLLVLAFGPEEDTCLCLGELRVKLAEDLDSQQLLVKSSGDHPLWVIDFPLFLRGEGGRLETCHHPFTAPHPDDKDLITSEPLKVRSLAYDLVMNGNEIGGGSVRAHCPSLQRELLTMLRVPQKPLEHLLNALSSGCPPHAGIALGLDRFVALACGADSIRDVIAFPKSIEGRDPLSGAPAPLTIEEQIIYHLQVKDN